MPEDSADARRWPLYSPESSAPPTSQIKHTQSESSSASSVGLPSPSASSGASAAQKRPGPRKPKIVLPQLPTTAKPKQLTTLAKSAMDWHTHVDAAALKDELEANRRGGSYLEKVEFIQRVEQRKEEVLQASKDRKRRRA